MASLKEVRTRISSVISTKQITSAMKMVSAAKLRRAQTGILKLRPYSAKLNEILSRLRSSVGSAEEAAYYRQGKVEKVLIVVLTSNRGLCGAFNSNAIKLALHTIKEHYGDIYEKGNGSLLCIGKKGLEFFSKRKYQVLGNFNSIFDDLTYENSLQVSEMLMKDFLEGKYDRIDIIYNRFRNAAVQTLVCEQFLPIAEMKEEEPSKDQTDYIFEPDKKSIVSELVPRTLKVQIYKTLLDSLASEHGARMTAMHKATDNAENILKELRLTYNKARQASITTEILEIISGANALKG